MANNTVVLGVIGADAHVVGNKVLAYTFKQAGLEVINLGIMTPQEEFIAAAIETNARAIAVSSLYGHGEIDCRGLREKCNEAGLTDILLYVGGNLMVGKVPSEEIITKFQAMGYDRVFTQDMTLDVFVSLMKADMGL